MPTGIVSVLACRYRRSVDSHAVLSRRRRDTAPSRKRNSLDTCESAFAYLWPSFPPDESDVLKGGLRVRFRSALPCLLNAAKAADLSGDRRA